MEIIKTALCSYGLSGKVFHAPFINLHPRFELIGSWERSKKLIQEDYPDVKSYSSLEALLTDEQVDLVVVNTPTYTHYEYTKQALLAGKHVVVEKAFTTTVAEAKELKDLAQQKQKKLSVYQNRRWDSDFQTIKKIIHSDLLGDIIEAEFQFARYKPTLSPKQHVELPGPGAGIIKDLGPHLIDQALHLFGMPDAVFADMRITRAASQIDDYLELILYYKKLRVKLKASFLVREPIPSYIIHGTKGSFLKSRADAQEDNLRAGMKPNTEDWYTEPESEYGLLHTEKDAKVIREKIKSSQGSYLGYYDAMYQSIVHHQPIPVTAEDGINVMQIIEAAINSSNQQKVITVCTRIH
ncbi:Gfo/Idh/MocA family oxidoreductase [Nostoc punctiforme FACHB-252]|uniref:Gfo/Idh/MocA family oxidoreductase n=1 Tax=Nostoc punctiforme FACHB-252 TaxID=1357509 RepID=A0ABR8H6B0_NOSPU|nr:Gfo/Idh/MocA family oxidoreductase [Nostoc punctiforme]MBD2611355.1 Gfo/Idh/MocA family oxidoreductase [Nostoc punctiforme FACHB-252]